MYLHSHFLFAQKASIYGASSEDQKDFINMLEPLNIEARYPTHQDQLLKSLTLDRCKEIIQKTQELREWLVQRL